MKKTFTINISGTVFQVDEDAFNKLKQYLQNLSEHFKNEEGGDEIINDIEARIAELLGHKTYGARDVVTITMVNEVMEIMGVPEDFHTNEEEPENKQEQTGNPYSKYSATQSKRLYRDPESRVIGGVCSGLAHYLKLDKALVRILFIVVSILTSGVALPAYLILWIAVPKARTTAQRLEMKGEDVNVNNIGKSVKEEFSEMKENFEKYKSSKEYQKSKEYARRASHNAQNAGREAASVISKIFGAIIFVFGVLSMIGLLFVVIVVTKAFGFLPGFIGPHESSIFFDQLIGDGLTTTFIVSIFVIAVIPFLLMIYAGTKMMFNYYSNSKNIVLTSAGVWILAIVVAIASSVGAIDGFRSDASITERHALNNASDTIYIEVDEYKFDDFDNTHFQFNNVKVMRRGNEKILISKPAFTIEGTDEDTPTVKIRKSSRGSSYEHAKQNADQIEYDYTLSKNKLVLDPYFTIDDNEKWRNQELNITLRIPEGKVVFLNDNLLPIIKDIKNTSNTWDGDMTNKYWQMKPEGLTYINIQ